MASSHERARHAFDQFGGTLRTKEALAAGIHPRTLYAMRDVGEVEQLARGVFRLTSLAPLSDPDLATVAKRVPQGVVCLISALAFHQLTTPIPHEVHLALPRSARGPSLEYPPASPLSLLLGGIRGRNRSPLPRWRPRTLLVA